MRSHLLILGERDAIALVVSLEQMGFTADRVSSAIAAVSAGDELFLYATRGAFHNPTRDRGRVFGRAIANSGAEKRKEPVLLVGRTFTHGFAFDLDSLAPPRHGVDLADLIRRLSSFPNKTGWAMSLRRTSIYADSQRRPPATPAPSRRSAGSRRVGRGLQGRVADADPRRLDHQRGAPISLPEDVLRQR